MEVERALDHLRTFVARYPPVVLREPNPLPAMRSTRTVLEGARPLVRLTSALDVPDDTVPPLLGWADLEILHHRLVAAGRTDGVRYVKWVCKAYEDPARAREIADALGALEQRRERCCIRAESRPAARVAVRVEHLLREPERFVHVRARARAGADADGRGVRRLRRRKPAVDRHLREQVERALGLGGAGRGRAGADHLRVEERVGDRMCNVAHVRKEVPGLSLGKRGGNGEERADEARVGHHGYKEVLGFVVVQHGEGIGGEFPAGYRHLVRLDVKMSLACIGWAIE